MSGSRIHKKKYNSSLTIISAIVGTLIFHSILSYTLTVKPVVIDKKKEDSLPPCVFISSHDDATEMEKELHAWSFIADPTLLSLPNNQHGFALIRKNERLLPVESLPDYIYNNQYADKQLTEFALLTERDTSLDQNIVTYWKKSPIPLPAMPGPVKLPKKLIWRQLDGKELTGMPEIPEDAIKAALKNGKPNQPNQIELIRSKPVSRIILRQSCGNAEFDQLALNTFKQAVLTIDLPSMSGVKIKPENSIPELENSGIYELEWQLLPLINTITAATEESKETKE